MIFLHLEVISLDSYKGPESYNIIFQSQIRVKKISWYFNIYWEHPESYITKSTT